MISALSPWTRPGELAEGDLGGVPDEVATLPGAKGGRLGHELHAGQPEEPGADVVGSGEDEVAHLHQRGRALVASRAFHHEEGTHRLHRTVSGLGPP